jgi:hypothetical protein
MSPLTMHCNQGELLTYVSKTLYIDSMLFIGGKNQYLDSPNGSIYKNTCITSGYRVTVGP